MLMMKERRPGFRTIEGWARSVLLEAGAIRECEEHGWMRDRADPHARERALAASPRRSAAGLLTERCRRRSRKRSLFDRRQVSGLPARGRLDDASISGPWKYGKPFTRQPWPLSAGHSLPELLRPARRG